MEVELPLPRTKKLDYYDPDTNEIAMEFRLIYQGKLLAEKWSYTDEYARAVDKQRLRKHFHHQLRELWKQHPDLRRQAEQTFRVVDSGWAKSTVPVVPGQHGKTWLEHIADSWSRLGTRFVPLVSEPGGFTCSLDILFLRRGHPGDLISSYGDIDSRIKVLLDGLRMPERVQELGGLPIEADENPFFCLLQDDKLITSLSVTTDRLLTPLEKNEQTNDVQVIVHATINNPGAIFAGGRLV